MYPFLNSLRRLLAVMSILMCLVIRPDANGGISPIIAGDGPGDSVRVVVSVNDTLGNAADADSIVLLWSHRGTVFDSIIVTGPGYRLGQYILVHSASDNGALGDYQVLAHARVQGRSPITNYTYQVIKGGLLPLATVNDSNLARAATADAYQADLTPCGAGNGAIPCTLFVMTIVGADTVAVQGVFVRVYNAGETATAAAGTTNADGRVVFSLEETDYRAYAYQSGYQFSPQPKTVSVDSNGVSDTLYATAFNPGTPATADLCRVFGWVFNLSGDTLNGATVNTRIVQSPLRYQNVVISPYRLSTVTDASGYWYLDLFPSSALTPDTTRYEFTIRFTSGAILRRQVAVPDSSAWLLTW